jgi:neutral ceramidase
MLFAIHDEGMKYVTLLFAWALSGFLLAAEPLLSGWAVVDITPPVGWRCAGSYTEVLSRGVHDPLLAKAVYLQQGEKRCVVVISDLCSVGRDITGPARVAIAKRTGIPAEHVIISATHTHGGPEYYGTLWEIWHEQAKQKHGGKDPQLLEDYVGKLQKAWLEVTEQAVKHAEEQALHVTTAQQYEMAYNRRFHMKDGSVRTNPGRMNVAALREAGPTDPDLPVLVARDLMGQTRGLFYTFAMHTAVRSMGEFSADFPAVVERCLKQELGAGLISIYGQACAGDVNHIKPQTVMKWTPDEECEEIGRRLAGTMMAALPRVEPVRAELRVMQAVVEVPLQEITAEAVARSQALLELKLTDEPAFLLSVDAYRVLNTKRYRDQFGDKYLCEIQAIGLGKEVAILALPHEIFVEHGLAVKRAVPYKHLFFVTLANDMDFYVPTLRAFAEGGYEVTTSSMKPGGGEMLVEKAIQVLKELHEQ